MAAGDRREQHHVGAGFGRGGRRPTVGVTGGYGHAAVTTPVVATPRDRTNTDRAEEVAPLRAEELRFERQYALEDAPVGEGTYGAVYRAHCKQTGRTVAVKRVKTEHETDGVPSTALREVAVLKVAEHPNIVRLLDVSCTPGLLHLVFEFVELNLKQYMRRYGFNLQPAAVRNLQQQLTRGIDYCHSRRIIHRDLKPQNVLVDEQGTVTVKIADFGMARAFCMPIPRYTHEVVTTWYRAPEILFGAQEYSLPVDMWSAGCILGELATGSALFHGDSEIDTIFQIFRKRGTPTSAEWPGLAELPDFKPAFPQWARKPWEEVRNTVAQLGLAGTELLDGMLQYDPLRRISARQALAHAYFQVPPPAFVGPPPAAPPGQPPLPPPALPPVLPLALSSGLPFGAPGPVPPPPAGLPAPAPVPVPPSAPAPPVLAAGVALAAPDAAVAETGVTG